MSMNDEEVEKLAIQEILSEAKRLNERASTEGALGWSRPQVAPVNKNFLTRVIRSVNSSNKHRNMHSSVSNVMSNRFKDSSSKSCSLSQASDRQSVVKDRRSEDSSAKHDLTDSSVTATLKHDSRSQSRTFNHKLRTDERIHSPTRKRSRLEETTDRSDKKACRNVDSRFGGDIYTVNDYVKLNEEYLKDLESITKKPRTEHQKSRPSSLSSIMPSRKSR